MQTIMKHAVPFLLAISITGCSALLPEQAREQVRRQQPEVQPDYSRSGPPKTNDPAVRRLRDLVHIGMDIDLLYDRCGAPDSTLAKPQRLIYESCEGNIRFEAETKKGRISRLLY